MSTATEAPNVDPAVVDRLKQIWKALPTLNYYQLLGIEPAADDRTIKQAFYAASREYHPDRYFRFPNENFRNAVNTIYKRISEAYTVLKHRPWRESYDRQIQQDPKKVRFSIEEEEKRQKQGGSLYDGGSGPGKKYWMLAMDALRNKNKQGAVLQLQLAVGIEPGNAEVKKMLEEVRSK